MSPPELAAPLPTVLQALRHTVLELPEGAPEPTVEVSILSRSAQYLYRQGLEYTALDTELTGTTKRWLLDWTVDLPPNDYLLETRLDNVIQPYLTFTVGRTAGSASFAAPTPLDRVTMEALQEQPAYTTYRVLDSFFEGDDFPGIPAITIRLGGSPPTFALSSVVMHMVHSSGVEVDLTVDNDGIVINSAGEWDFYVPSGPREELIPGLWRWTMPTVDTAGSRFTYIVGHFKVIKRL